jgi:tetratricopeptide (TPR) repeat protein
MKKQFLSFVLMLVVSILWSQNQFVVSAFNYLRQGKLDKALQNIEPATTHPQTMNQAKTWLYRGNIYLAIHLTKEEKYKNLAVSPLDSAFVSYDKALQLDPEFYMPTVDPASPKIGLKYVAEEYYNLGVDKYQNKDLQSAIKYFELAKKAETKRGAAQDSTSTYNASCYNIALAALTLKDTSTTIKNLNEVIKNKFKNLNAYILLSNLYLSKNDTSNAKKIINRGRTIFPDSVPMLIIEINYYLKSNNVKKAQEILQKAIQKDPSNPTLYYAIGANYDKLISTITNPEEKEKRKEKAIHANQKASELKPNNFDAIYN